MPRKINLEKISWQDLCRKIFAQSNSDPNEAQRNADNFSVLWQRMADYYLKKENIQEYNGIKHGFRIKSGGFRLRIGRENEFGIPPSDEEMNIISESKFGSSYLTLERLTLNGKDNRSFCSKKHSMNWSAEQVELLLELVSMSLKNVIAALKIVNGIQSNLVQFVRPSEKDAFERPWQFVFGNSSFTVNYSIDDLCTISGTKLELLELIRLQTEACKIPDYL